MTAPAPGLPLAPSLAGAGPADPCRRPWRQRRPRQRRLHKPLALAVSVAVTAAALGACGAGRDVLGTNAGPCFMALPTAKRAVGGRGSLAGIRLVDVSRFTARNGRAMYDLLSLLPVRPAHDVCLVAYTGSFTPGQVEQPLGPPPSGGMGRYAIAVVTTPKPGLLGTFVVRHEPLNFTRLHVGF
jgi:hypothetical protein